jgi:plasmid stabilization system protein ParE
VAPLKILFTSRARREMREIIGFIAQDNLDAASSLAEQILTGLDHKARFPKSGRVIPEAPEQRARELVLPPCRIFYLTDQTTLHVLSIMRSERLLKLKQLEN